MDGKRAALALGSGGARGYAHIGVIEELRDRGYDVVGVAGSSMGALVGGLHAVGRLDDFADWAKALSQSAVLRLLDPAWRGPGVFRAEKVLDVVRELLGEAQIEDLTIPYTAVSTDLITGKSLWLQRGPLDTAIRASIAIPGMISPHIADGRVLVDGGILDPLPVGPLAATNADVTIAVSLSAPDSDGSRFYRAESEPSAATEWFNRLVRNTSALFDTPAARSVLSRFAGADDDEEEAEEKLQEAGVEDDDVATASAMVPKLGSFEVMNRSIDIMQAALARHQMAAYPPDILIEVPRSSSRSLDFHRAAELIDIGHDLAVQALDSYEAERNSNTEPPRNDS
ncbi:MAG TPA: patatin-like phospholipase family protein [Mycobacterium sp.]|nr:patatin-like phospholipase family protein [Mycobacterium sp.]